MKSPFDDAIYVCVECGETFTERRGVGSLEEHWSLWGHGPEGVQADAIDRARWVHTGEPVPDHDPA